jgi:hypothetical protein
MWPYNAIEKKAKSGRLKGYHQPVGDSEEQSVHLNPEELKYILDIRPPHGSPDFPEENLNYVRKNPVQYLNLLPVLRDDTWLFRFTTEKSIFPNGDNMVYGLWDVAAPVGHPSWKKGCPTIEGGHLSTSTHDMSKKDQRDIRNTIGEDGEDMYTYQILASNYFGAINNKVVRV